MTNVQEKLHESIDELIRLNIAWRKSLPIEIRPDLGEVDYAIDLCTVKCSIGRLAGHSEYIKRRVDEHSLIIVAGKSQASVFDRETGLQVFTANQIAKGAVNGSPAYTMVYIDDPKYVFKRIAEYDLYQNLVVNGSDQTFIQLGT